MAKLRITYKKSAIGYSYMQKETIRALGLRKLNSVIVQDDTPSIRGMIFKVKHLVVVEEVAGDTSVEQPVVKPAKVRATKPAVSGEASDNLQVIEGIGPKIASVLNSAGITTFTQLSEALPARLSEIMQQAKLRLANPESWPEQAALAAAGKWDDLKVLQGQLTGGRRSE
jgi:large subunit ribosomal protein L30